MAKARKRLPRARMTRKLALSMTDEARELLSEHTRLMLMHEKWFQLSSAKGQAAERAAKELWAQHEDSKASFHKRAREVAERIVGRRYNRDVASCDLPTLAVLSLARADANGLADHGLSCAILAAAGAPLVKRGRMRLPRVS